MRAKPFLRLFGILAFVIGQAAVGPSLSFQPAFAAEAAATAPDLTGTVKSPDGRVVSDASIFLYTAGPRVGTGYL